ncbi:hypothetical protein JTB14_037854 [Gonioctena quinquepunctata]|nr:hypothetical protein JTB14_037854 [Gonioctena quinquepunctata]
MKRLVTNVILIFFLHAVVSADESSNESMRVYGGRDVEIDDTPYIVSILSYHVHLCAGTILGKNWIITAAHCVINRDSEELMIYAGVMDLLSLNTDMQEVTVKKIIIHPNYKHRRNSIQNDVALLNLDHSLNYTENISPIKLLNLKHLKSLIELKEPGMITGWGSDEESIVSNTLHTAAVELLSDEECSQNDIAGCDAFEPGAHLCNRIENNFKAAGYLDDGGPLVMRKRLAGLILHGKHYRDTSCPHISSIYAAIPHCEVFIKNHLPELYEEDDRKNQDREEEGEGGEEDGEGFVVIEIELVFKPYSTIANPDAPKMTQHTYAIKSNAWLLNSRKEEKERAKEKEEEEEMINPDESDEFSEDSDADVSGNLLETRKIEPDEAVDQWVFNVKLVRTSEVTKEGFSVILFRNSVLTLYASMTKIMK